MRCEHRLDTLDPTPRELVFGWLKAHGLHFHIEPIQVATGLRARSFGWTKPAFDVKRSYVLKTSIIESKHRSVFDKPQCER